MIAHVRWRRDGQRGQGLVEFALLVPVFMLLLLAMLEFGFLFDQMLTIQYASREGARVGSALVNGGGKLGCPPSVPAGSPNAATVDPLIIAAVTRVLDSPGSRVNMAEVPTITIYNADGSGSQISTDANAWRRAPGAGPRVPPVTGSPIDYTLAGGDANWPACHRSNGSPPDSIGVSLTYTYRFQTALGSVLSWTSITVSDRTVMAMNPTD